jgi:16S rRNA (guanine966-N2)-methyltransferase
MGKPHASLTGLQQLRRCYFHRCQLFSLSYLCAIQFKSSFGSKRAKEYGTVRMFRIWLMFLSVSGRNRARHPERVDLNMRIIAGQWKGFSLSGPVAKGVRPTTDRVKESIFNLMGISIPDGVVLDLFAGTGALGLEALSRGARFAVFVDCHEQSLTVVKQNISKCRAEADTQVWRCDWSQGIRRFASKYKQVSWVFLDPPYDQQLWIPAITSLVAEGLEVTDGIVCEHPMDTILPDNISGFVVHKRKSYGDIGITIYHQIREADL